MNFRKIIVSLLTLSMLVGCSSGGEEFSSVDDLQEFAEEEEVNYTILSEDVPNFDTAPIPYHDYGYIYLENGSYGFVNAANENMVPSGRYANIEITGNQMACMYGYDSSDHLSIDQTLGLVDYFPCAGAGGIGWRTVVGNDNQVYTVGYGEVTLTQPSDYAYYALKGDPNNYYNIDRSTYYMVAKDLQKIYGPYDVSEMASFSVLRNQMVETLSDQVGKTSPYYGTMSLFEMRNINYGLFYEKTDQGYIIHSVDGLSSSAETYDYAEPISETGMKVEKDGKMGVVDTSLNEVYMGDFEDVSELINNRGYVKVDGKWLYVEFGESSNTEDSASEEKKEPEQIYVSTANKYYTLNQDTGEYYVCLPEGWTMDEVTHNGGKQPTDAICPVTQTVSYMNHAINFTNLYMVYDESYWNRGIVRETLITPVKEEAEASIDASRYTLVDSYGESNQYVVVYMSKDGKEINARFVQKKDNDYNHQIDALFTLTLTDSADEAFLKDFMSDFVRNSNFVDASASKKESASTIAYEEGYITLSGTYTTETKENHNYSLIELDAPVSLKVDGKVYESIDKIELAEEVINGSVKKGDSIIVYGKLEKNEISEVSYADYYLNHAFICSVDNYVPGLYSLTKNCVIYDKPNGTKTDAKISKGKKIIIIFIFLHKDGSSWALTSDHTWVCLKDKSGNSNAECIQKMNTDAAKTKTNYVPGTYTIKKEIQVYDEPSKTTKVRVIKQDEEVIITYVFIDLDGHIWGMIKDGEWIYLDENVSLKNQGTETSADNTQKEAEEEECPYATGTYRLNYDMNVRTEAVYKEDESNIITVKSAGSQVNVSEIVKDSNGAYWGKIGDKQWICIWGSYNGGAKDYMTRI